MTCPLFHKSSDLILYSVDMTVRVDFYGSTNLAAPSFSSFLICINTCTGISLPLNQYYFSVTSPTINKCTEVLGNRHLADDDWQGHYPTAKFLLFLIILP